MRMNLRAARVNKNLSQAQAAKLLGISVETLSRFERGITFPNVPIITKMEEVYGLSYDEIIFLPENNG